MSSAYESTGRTQQKARTRSALRVAARELLSEGRDPTVEEAADRAGISRSTAYRYFPNQRALLVALHPEMDQPSLLGEPVPQEPRERLGFVLDRMLAVVLEWEPEVRAQLRLSLVPGTTTDQLPLRQGRGIGWIEDALAPCLDRLGKAELRRLALAIRATSGIESFVWLTDVAGVSRREAVRIMRRSALDIFDAAMAS